MKSVKYNFCEIAVGQTIVVYRDDGRLHLVRNAVTKAKKRHGMGFVTHKVGASIHVTRTL